MLAAIERQRRGIPIKEKAIKPAELDAILAAPAGYGDDVPIDEDFHARRLPDTIWRHSPVSDNIEAVYQLHRLREVMALVGFTRFEAMTPDINGEYDHEVERAPLALEPQWFPAVENRGEGIFLHVRAHAIASWMQRPAVIQRIAALQVGHEQWKAKRQT